jgi:hypothetical protein
VDANQGVYRLGSEPLLTNYTPRFVGYSVSRDNGVTFQDQGVPPLSREGTPTNDDGDAGDPVLAVDRGLEVVYLAGTSPRNAGGNGIPLWKSTDGGVTFGQPTIVRDDITNTDKPWIAVDNATGTGQHDVYLTSSKIPFPEGLWLTVSTNGGSNWNLTNSIQQIDGTNVISAQSAIPVVGPDHVAYTFWFERTGTSSVTNWLKMRKVQGRGATLGDILTVRRLVTTNSPNGNLELLRSNTATNTDTFRVFAFPVPAVNPVKTNLLYVAYADKGTNTNDKADVYFVRSTDGGTNWTSPVRVNTVWTNDQWMPLLAVKPDGTKLFMGWYDRRNDTNNSLIDVYGRWATIASNGDVSFYTNDFRVTTTNFPPVFVGTDTNNLLQGHYDPVYPGPVNLHWHYPEWPDDPNVKTLDTYNNHVGEYDGAWADGPYVYVTWTDGRRTSTGTQYPRNQRDIRFVRITWPEQ